MENGFIVNSIGIGGAIFAGLILFWFISIYIKKRLASEQPSPDLSPTTKTAWDEKRLHERTAISWQAVIDSFDRTDAVHLRDISLGGAFVACSGPLSLRDRFTITIKVPEHGPLHLNAEVVWSNFNMPEKRVVNRGMGIRFVENTEENRQQLSNALKDSIQDKNILSLN